MADIFISYAKADRDLAAKLSAVLEAEGWSVWWDTSLASGDSYRDEIMKQLAAARAVITIWTETSIKSDWVRAESGRAKADGKLIPVKARALTYADIPLPFGEMHTENVDAPELIKAAVVAQLAKPAVAPSNLWLTTRTFRLQLLTWGGIVGGAMTLFANLRGLFSLADWVSRLVAGWLDWAHAFWSFVLSWIGLPVPRDVVPSLSFAVFITMLVVGTRLRLRGELATFGEAYTVGRSVRRFTAWVAAYAALALLTLIPMSRANTSSTWIILGWSLLIFVGLPALALVSRKRQRLQGVVSAIIYLVFAVIISIEPWLKTEGASIVAPVLEASVIVLGAIAIMSFVPLRAINRRFVFLLMGLLLLMALNEVSKLHLDQYVLSPKAPT